MSSVPLSFLLSLTRLVISTKSPPQSPLFPLQLPLLSFPPHRLSLSLMENSRGKKRPSGLHADRAKVAQRGALFPDSDLKRKTRGPHHGSCYCTQEQKPEASWVSGLPFTLPQPYTHTTGLSLSSVPFLVPLSTMQTSGHGVGLTSSPFIFIPDCYSHCWDPILSVCGGRAVDVTLQLCSL